MKQKNYFNDARRSRWLPTLVMLLAMFAGGVSPAWAQTTILSEGFESNSLATNGWTTSNPGSSGIYSGAKKTGSYGYRFYYYSSGGPRYLISPELTIPSNASDITLSFYHASYSTNYGDEKFKVGYSTTTNSTDAFTWSDEQIDNSTDWKEYTDNTIPKGTKYIAIQYTSGNAYYLFVDDINLTCTVSGPAMSVLDGTSGIASGYSYGFGLTTAGTTKTFTLSNSGTEACPVSVGHTGSFGAELSATSIPAGGEVTLTVTMPNASGNDVITVSSTADGIDDFVINVSGTVKDPEKVWCDFTSGLPTGWTNGGLTVSTSGAGDGTTGGGYISDTGYNYSLTTPLLTFDGSEKMLFVAARTQSSSSYCGLTVEYSANGTTWTALTVPAVADIAYYYNNSWTPIEISDIPAGDYFIKFTLKYLRITDIYGGTESTAPVIALSQASYDFGLISANSTSSDITITNTGKSALTGMTVTSDNANFTVAVANDATEIAANGGTATFTVTMAPNATGSQSATITVKSSNADDLVFTATGAVAKPGTTTVDFNDNALPAGWTNSTGYYYWSFANETASAGSGSSYSGYASLTSPKLIFDAGDFLAIKLKAQQSSYGFLKVYTSTDGTFGSTAFKEINYSDLSTTDYKTIVVDGISSEVKFLKFEGYYVTVDEIAGLTYAPVLTVTTGDPAATVTTPAAYPFGEIGANATVTYNFTNTGAGTINITNVASDNAVFTTNWTSEVAADNYDLVITANYDADKAGEQNGAITVTTTEGAFVINLTSTFLAANAPSSGLYIGDATDASASGAAFDYGIITANTSKPFKIKNDGTGTLKVTNIALPEGYSIDITAPTTEAPLSLTAGQSQTVNLTLAATAKAIRNDNITISFDGGLEDFTFAAKAYILTGTETVNFASEIPSRWENESNGWSISDGAAKCTGKKNLTTQKLTFTGDNDFFIFKVKASDSGSGDYVTVEGDDGSGEWTAFAKKTYSYSSDFGASTADYSTIVVDGIPSSVKRIRFNGYYVLIDEIAGLTYDDNDPIFAYYTDSECNTAATATVTKNYGFVTTDVPDAVVYYMKNDGTGTLNLTLGEVPTGFTAELGKTSLTAGESTTLTINMPIATKGYRSGDIVVTGKDSGDNTLGTFTFKGSGVVVEDGKLNLNFATDNIPAGWTANDWEKNSDGYLRAGYSSTSMETTKLVATAGEQLVVIAKNEYSSSSYTFGVKYKDADDANAEWTDLIPAANIGTDFVTLHGTIAEAGNYLLQFNGNNTQIQRIYGLTEASEPLMVVYDGENIAGSTHNFGNVTDEADATWTLTVKNEGLAKLEGLTAELTGDQQAHYSVEITGATGADGNEIEASASATITVKQLKDNLGAHEATLTISATGLDSKVITLSGSTRDASKLYVDFADNTLPDGWKAESDWTIYYNYARQNNETTASSLFTVPVTVAEGQAFSFKAKRNNTSKKAELTVRYTTNGGVTWTEYDWNEYSWKEEGISEQITSTAQTFEVTGLAAGTTVFEFYGKNLQIDDIQANYDITAAPLMAFTKSTDNISGANLTADAEATYTLTNNGNADYVGTVATSNVHVLVGGTGVSYNGSGTLTIPAGKTAEITVTMPFAAPYGEKNANLSITSDSWVADIVADYTANLVDPDAINVDFASLPAGWYNDGWTVDGSAHVYSGVEKEFISEQFAAEEGKNVLSFKAKAQNGAEGTLKVYTSTDRKTWSEPTEFTLTNEYANKSLTALADGNYYVKFVSMNANIDDLVGLKKIATVPEHDLYVSASNIPTETKVPGTEITATATVNSLRADETGVYAKLLFGDAVVATATAEDISLNGSKDFTLTGNVPAEEGTYAAKIVVYYSDNSVASETATTDVVVEHIRTLEIASFTRTDGNGTLDANSSNQISPVFSVTVTNTGTTEATPTVKIYQGETEVASATAAAAIAKDETSDAIALTATDMSAGEGGALEFTAKVFWNNTDTEAKATSATPVTINVNAAAPKFELADANNTAMTDGDDVAFGLVREATAKTFTIKNTGNKALELVSIVAPEGYDATAVTDANKTIAAGESLDINVTLKAEQGKKSGDMVFTYKVDATNNATFTLALSGRSIAANTWTEDFATGIPASWENKGWTVEEGVAYSGGYETVQTLMTPRLAATNGEELTYDATFRYTGYTLTVEYSTDKTTWNSVATINDENAGEQTFTAPAAGNYYLRFTGTRYAQLDNFVGFTLNIPEHDTEIAAASIPTTGTQYGTYTATVTLKENAGKAEKVTATLYVNNVEKAAETETITANGSTVVTVTWKPDAVITDAVEAYLKVTADGIDLATDKVNLTIAAPFTLSDIEAPTFAEATTTYEALVLNREFVEGWNTVCLPFAITDIEEFFGDGAKAYTLNSYVAAENTLKFESATTMNASYPYVVYVPAAIASGKVVENVEIGSQYDTPSTTATYFVGTYAPIDDMSGKWGIGTAKDGKAKIMKGITGAKMKGFRAYFALPGNTQGAPTMMFDEEVITGISAIEMAAEEGERIYNLNGQRVMNPKRGQMYIVNGKKVAIK